MKETLAGNQGACQFGVGILQRRPASFMGSGIGGDTTPRSTAISTCSYMDTLHHERMKVRLGVALLALILLVVVIACPRPTPPPIEPSYAGRTLSEWILRSPNALNGNPRSREAREAIRKIGTNALPCLLAWLAADPDHSPIKRAASSVLDEVPQGHHAKARPCLGSVRLG